MNKPHDCAHVTFRVVCIDIHSLELLHKLVYMVTYWFYCMLTSWAFLRNFHAKLARGVGLKTIAVYRCINFFIKTLIGWTGQILITVTLVTLNCLS